MRCVFVATEIDCAMIVACSLYCRRGSHGSLWRKAASHDFTGKFLLRVPYLILSLRICQRGVSMYVFMFSVYGADICAATFTHLAQAEGGCAGGMHLPISGIALLLI